MQKNVENKILITIQYQNESIEELEIYIRKLEENNINKKDIIIICDTNYKELEKFTKKEKIKLINEIDLNHCLELISNTIEFDYLIIFKVGDFITKELYKEITDRNNYNENMYVFPLICNNKLYSLSHKKQTNFYDLNDKKCLWIHLNSVLISKNILKNYLKMNIDSPKTLLDYQNIMFLSKLIIINGGYEYRRGRYVTTKQILEDSNESLEIEYNKNWYLHLTNTFDNIFKFSKTNYNIIFDYLQKTYIYYLKIIFSKNTNTKNKHVITKFEKEFYEKITEILEKIDNNIIVEASGNKLINTYILKLKNKNFSNEYKYQLLENSFYLMENNKTILNIRSNKLKIFLMENENNTLNIIGELGLPINEEKFKIGCLYGGKKIYAQRKGLYSDYKIFGKTIYNSYIFNVKIPLKKQNEYIKFFIEYDEKQIYLDIKFQKPQSKLNNTKYSYWNCGDYTLNYRKNSLFVLKNNKLRHIKRELKYMLFLLKTKRKNIVWIRLLYYFSKIVLKNKIWLFEDKIYKAGDNGEYLYNYSLKQKDKINKYYILKNDCLDAKRFKKEGKKFVKFGSIKHKLLYLRSDIVFNTHNNSTKHHSFDEDIELYFRDLYNFKNVCIQHGLTVQHIPHLTNRVNDNLKMFFLASPIEKNNMSSDEYCYDDLSILKITGSPRYDGLINKDKKQILITPTWRNYLASPILNIDDVRNKNNTFKNSEYYKIYNSLINNKKLLDIAKKTGYKIIYLLHPCTSPQINDFDKNEQVELIAATDDLNYEQILTESSLMITDYSGVQFDFAYMYKPIVYYHPNELPPSYEEGAYEYKTMALGEIVDNETDLVDKVCNYMRNNCKIKKEIKKRIDSFFEYHDANNCERIYNEIIKEFYEKK